MHIALWAIQCLLAAAFLGAGLMKATQPNDVLRERIGDWVDRFGETGVTLIGVAEVLGAVALVVPPIVGTGTVLTPVAAAALAITMALAVALHVSRSEPFVPPLVLGLLSVVVAVGRFAVEPF